MFYSASWSYITALKDYRQMAQPIQMAVTDKVNAAPWAMRGEQCLLSNQYA